MNAADVSMNLRTLQTHFAQSMFGEGDASLLPCVRPAGKLSPAQSMAVYRRNMEGALLRALQDIHPVCAQLLGDAKFRGIATGYMRLYPSRHSDLNLYGKGFADFLQSYCDEHVAPTDNLACLPELARLEWSHHRAWYAEDDAVFDLSAFSRVEGSGYEHLVFDLSQSLALFSSHYSLYSIWHSRTASARHTRKEYLCVCRDGLRPILVRLSTQTHRLLGEIAAGVALGALSRRFGNLASRLPPLIEKGWVTSFHFEADGKEADAGHRYAASETG